MVKFRVYVEFLYKVENKGEKSAFGEAFGDLVKDIMVFYKGLKDKYNVELVTVNLEELGI